MNYGGAFSYMFSSENWVKKFVLGIAMSLTPFLGPIILFGYALDVLRNLNQGKADPLPDWTGDDFARWLGRGLGLTVSMVTFLLPVIAVLMILWICFFLLLPALGTDVIEDIGGAFAICMACLWFILYFIIALAGMVVMVRYASTDRLDVGLDYMKNFQLVGANIAPLLIIVVLMAVLGFVSVIVGFLTLGLLFLALPTYFYLVMAYFGAQLSKQPGFTD
jgi:hypothetical protein